MVCLERQGISPTVITVVCAFLLTMVRRKLMVAALAAGLGFGVNTTYVRADEKAVQVEADPGLAGWGSVDPASTTSGLDADTAYLVQQGMLGADPVAEAEAGLVDEYMAKAAAEVTSSVVSPLEQTVSPASSSTLVDKLSQIRDRKALRPAPVALFTGDAKEELDASSADAAYKGNQ